MIVATFFTFLLSVSILVVEVYFDSNLTKGYIKWQEK